MASISISPPRPWNVLPFHSFATRVPFCAIFISKSYCRLLKPRLFKSVHSQRNMQVQKSPHQKPHIITDCFAMPPAIHFGRRQALHPAQWCLVPVHTRCHPRSYTCAASPTPSSPLPATSLAAAAVDAKSAELARLQACIQWAVAEEAYGQAAALNRRASALQAADALTQLRAAMSSAVAAQDYAGAAALRDASYRGLLGWWRVTADGQDAWGHLVHISEAYGRLAARGYTPSHIADMHGWRQESPYRSSVGNANVSEAGLPLFEIVFYHDSEGA
jgi:hypothetical protein